MVGKRSFQEAFVDSGKKKQKPAFLESRLQHKPTPPEVPIGRPSLASREVVSFISAHTADGSYDVPGSSNLFTLYNLPPASTKKT